MTFRKDDAGKPKMHLLPPEALIGAAQALTHGAVKYEDKYNWRNDPEWNRYYDATMRHLVDWQQGKEMDESGCETLDCALASLMILNALTKTETGTDDRYKREPDRMNRRRP